MKQKHSEARFSMRLSDDLKQMAYAVAAFEDRSISDVFRQALKYYCQHNGYFDPGFAKKFHDKQQAQAMRIATPNREETP